MAYSAETDRKWQENEYDLEVYKYDTSNDRTNLRLRDVPPILLGQIYTLDINFFSLSILCAL